MGLGMTMRDPDEAQDDDKIPSEVGDADERPPQGRGC